MQAYGKVGKKGTLYPPKAIRQRLNLKEGDMVQYLINGNNLLVVKILDPLELASEFNIPFDAKKAMKMISEVRKESEREIEHETLEALKRG
ncbi:MAG: AbrB/MazE/SpoVT family DNA-binding domain-containing protein [Nitrososphaerales archaeon]